MATALSTLTIPPKITQTGAFLLALEALELHQEHPVRVADLYYVIAQDRLTPRLPTDIARLLHSEGSGSAMDPSTTFLILDFMSRHGFVNQVGSAFSLSEAGREAATRLRSTFGYDGEELIQHTANLAAR